MWGDGDGAYLSRDCSQHALNLVCKILWIWVRCFGWMGGACMHVGGQQHRRSGALPRRAGALPLTPCEHSHRPSSWWDAQQLGPQWLPHSLVLA